MHFANGITQTLEDDWRFKGTGIEQDNPWTGITTFTEGVIGGVGATRRPR